ncbi:uncharacterized protein RBU57_017326 [Macrochelys suwanniensis]
MEGAGVAEVSAWVRAVLGRFPLGLKVGKLKEALRSEHGLDLEELSRQWGCGDALQLLRALPHLWLRDPSEGNACLARLGAGVAEVSAWVRAVLGRFPLGLKVGKLKEALRSEHGLDLEELSRQRGCGDALQLLRALPHLRLRDPSKGNACLARLGVGRWASGRGGLGGSWGRAWCGRWERTRPRGAVLCVGVGAGHAWACARRWGFLGVGL